MATTCVLEDIQYSSGPKEFRRFREAASQSWLDGELLYLDANGCLTVCASNATAVAGLAQGPASGVTNTMQLVLVPNSGTTFEASLSGTAQSSAVAYTDLGVKYALLSHSNRAYVDCDDTDNDAFVIVELKRTAESTGYATGKNIIGDTNARGYIKILPAVLQLGDAAESA